MLDEELAAAPDTALHGDQGSLTLAAGWPMASHVFNQRRNNTANPGERSASAPGPSRPESRSSNAGIPVKCSRNRRQVRRNPQATKPMLVMGMLATRSGHLTNVTQ
jgi:hypothetical protein